MKSKEKCHVLAFTIETMLLGYNQEIVIFALLLTQMLPCLSAYLCL